MHTGMLGQEIITITDNLQEISTKLMAQGNRERKEDMAKRLDYYQGRQWLRLQEILKEQFIEPDLMRLQPVFRNVVKTVIDKIALVYKDAPKREVLNSSNEPDEATQAKWDAIEESSELNVIMKTINRLTTLLGRTLLKVGWRDGRIAYDIITPNILDIVVDPNDILRPVAVIWNIDPVHRSTVFKDRHGNVKIGFINENIRFEFWSTDEHEQFPAQHFVFKGDGKIVKNPDNPNNENPYRDAEGRSVLPCVPFASSFPVDDWFIGGGEDLDNAQETINVLLTHMQYLIKMQSFGIPIATGLPPKQQIAIDPSVVLRLPLAGPGEQQADFKFVTPDAKITEIQEIITKKFIDVASDYNISPENFNISGGLSSGISLKLRNMNLLDYRSDQIELYRAAERKLYSITRIVNNNFASSANQLPDDTRINIDFAEVGFPEDPKVERETLTLGVELAVDSAVDFTMRKNPDLDRAGAEAKVQQNIADKNRVSSRFTGSLQSAAQRAANGGNNGG